MSDEADQEPVRKRAQVEWIQDEIKTTFANVVTIQGTREQIEIFYGTSRAHDGEADTPLRVDVSNRIIVTPYAAKRMHQLLTGVLREYESRHGVLKVDDR